MQSDARIPPAYTTEEKSTRSSLPEGLYILINKKARTLLNSDGGNSASGTLVVGYERNVNEKLDHQLWLIESDESEAIYSIRTFRNGTCLELEAGQRENKSRVFAHKRVESGSGRANQEWRILEEISGYYTIQCARTDTFLEIIDGQPDNGIGVTCSSNAKDSDHQLWELERASRSGHEIKSIIGLWRLELLDRLVEPYGDNVQYFVLPHTLRTTIWEGTKLARQSVRNGTFDYDDFLIKMKDAVNTWARDRLRLDGYSVLFGLIYGETRRGPKAYNWYLSPDMTALVFFDAQTNREYTIRSLDDFGFKPNFMLF